MPAVHNKSAEVFQAQFHRRWGHLSDPHVRDLAWLLDAPDLLDPDAEQWHGKIASLSSHAATDAQQWLVALDRAPAILHAYLDLHAFTRLGHYAEKLMAFYFRHKGWLVAHGLQVRTGKNETVGEFDFLLREGGRLLHWEFATKFYLLYTKSGLPHAGYFIGPNLADTLEAKMRKILLRQLALAQHPAAQIHLPQPLDSAQALIKGWLFYPLKNPQPVQMPGVSDNHCRGFWCSLAELDLMEGERYIVLPRLRWLAPAKACADQALSRQDLEEALSRHFAQDNTPVLVAVLDLDDGYAIESRRGFIVPDDWQRAAAHFRNKQAGKA